MSAPQAEELIRSLRLCARERGEEFSAALAWFCAERFAVRLGRSKLREEILLSGDLMLRAYLGDPMPFEWTADVLWLRPGSRYELALKLCEICSIDAGDGVDLGLRPEMVSEEMEVIGCHEVTVAWNAALGSMQIPVRLTVRWGDVAVPKPENYHFQWALKALENLPGSRVCTLPPTIVMAQRLQELVESGVAFDKPKSLADLYVLVERGKLKEEEAAVAIAATFARRATVVPSTIPFVLSDQFAAEKSRQQLWRAYLARSRSTEIPLAKVVSTMRTAVWPWIQQAASMRVA